jgi:uncharacterized protein
MTQTTKFKSHRIVRLLLFIVVAFAVSNIFRFNMFELNETLEHTFTWSYLIVHELLDGSGIFIAGIVGLFLLRKERTVATSFLGSSRYKSGLMVIIPMALLVIIGVPNTYGVDIHVFGIIAAVGSVLYCIMEEYGWRGYLQEEFHFLHPNVRFVLIGCIWYSWHLSFLTEATLLDNLFFLGALLLGSWGIGKVAELTHSILACACIHLIVNIFLFNPFFNNAFSQTAKLTILFVCISAWIIILVKWKKGLKMNS